MKKYIGLIATAFLASQALYADVIASWTFTVSTPVTNQVATTFDANLDSGGSYNDLTRGAGAAATSAGSAFRTVGFQNNGISTTNTDYFEIILSADTGYTLSLASIDAVFAGTGTYSASPGVSMQWAYSLDGSTFTLIDSPVVQVGNGTSAFDFSGTAALQDISADTDVTLRFYASGQTSTGGWGFSGASALTPSSVGLTINGSLSVVPEPTVFALMAIGGLAIARFARRRNA